MADSWSCQSEEGRCEYFRGCVSGGFPKVMLGNPAHQSAAKSSHDWAELQLSLVALLRLSRYGGEGKGDVTKRRKGNVERGP